MGPMWLPGTDWIYGTAISCCPPLREHKMASLPYIPEPRQVNYPVLQFKARRTRRVVSSWVRKIYGSHFYIRDLFLLYVPK